MPVYAVKWNSMHPGLFLSCSADWSVKVSRLLHGSLSQNSVRVPSATMNMQLTTTSRGWYMPGLDI
jgi:hypothetical protein